MKVVVDTNCLLASFSKKSPYRWFFDSILRGITLVFTTDILLEIEQDADDNKFVDCYVAANADYLITHDGHYKILDKIDFPKVRIITLPKFATVLNEGVQ